MAGDFTPFIIAAITLIVGWWAGDQPLWLPLTVFVASVIDGLTRSWYSSPKVGSWVSTSVALKFGCSLIGFYAAIGQLICLGLLGWWLFA